MALAGDFAQPNFLILLGNRYGWRPLPEKILYQLDGVMRGVLNTIKKRSSRQNKVVRFCTMITPRSCESSTFG